MTDDDFDDLEITPDEQDEGYVRLRKEDLKSLRTAARKASSTARELAEHRRRDAVREAGIEGLSERQMRVVARETEGDATPEALRKVAEELGFIAPAAPSAEQQATDAEIDAHTEAVAATTGAPPAAHQTTVGPEDVAGWGVDKRMRLQAQHPDIYERLLREESVSLPASFS